MDGIHDLGGMHGFGPVAREVHEPVFHHDWERRVFGMNFAAIPHNVDQFRHAIETMEPAAYLGASYYEKWLHAIEHDAIVGGVVRPEELAAWRGRIASEGTGVVPRREDPSTAAAFVAAIRAPATAPGPGGGRFRPGDAVRVSRRAPSGHTRCPRYVRGADGTIEHCLGEQPLPDAGAAGERRAEPLYSVAFEAVALWGSGDHTVSVDLWESYLEPGTTGGH
jgi:nitrile hydratase subunit beta